MGWTKEVWRQGVAAILFEFANIPFQKALWTGKIGGYSSFFDEAICGFGDHGIPEHIDEFKKMNFISDSEANQLIALSDSIDRFCKGKEEVEFKHDSLWKNHEWINLSKDFKKVLQDCFEDDLADKGKPYEDWILKFPF